jgi:hypothetical protein
MAYNFHAKKAIHILIYAFESLTFIGSSGVSNSIRIAGASGAISAGVSLLVTGFGIASPIGRGLCRSCNDIGLDPRPRRNII